MRSHADKKEPLDYEISCKQERTTGLLDSMQIRKNHWFMR